VHAGPDWTTAEPAPSGSPLVNPSLYRESQPVWRIVAPVAVAANPNDIPTADTPRKELNITIVKTAPTKSAVNQILSYEIIVRNNSPESVDGLILEERVPDSLQVADVNPQASFENRTLHWTLSAFGPGEQRKLEVNLLATAAGDADSLTIARARAAVTSNTDVEKPQLRLEIIAEEKVGQGQVCPISYRVTNTSEEAIENLVLRSVLPSQLVHRKGSSLDLLIERLEPGESRTSRLHPRAERPGAARLTASVLVGGSSMEEADANVQVVGSSHPALCP
jgi:hypothetical protein